MIFVCVQQLHAYRKVTGRNRTGLPCSVGRPTAHASGPAAADCPRPHARRPARPPAGSVTDDDRLQTTTTYDRRQRAKQYWPIKRVNNNATARQVLRWPTVA